MVHALERVVTNWLSHPFYTHAEGIMPFGEDLDFTAFWANPSPLSTFESHIDPVWIDEALRATGTASLRRRRLPADQVVWLVLGMGLFRDRPINEVVDKLDLTLLDEQNPSVSSSASCQARRRLGDKPLAWLFSHTANHWAFERADKQRWRGLALFGVDGTSMRVPDTPENAEYFGYPPTGRDESSYPQLRLNALLALRSHLLAAVAFGPYQRGETAYADQLWDQIPDNSLTLLDRQYLFPDALVSLEQSGQQRHWMTRAKKNTRWRIIQRLGPHEAIVEMTVSRQARAKNPDLPRTWTARAIGYEIKGKYSGYLLTSLLDSKAYPADELVSLYPERWEHEQGYDELKTELLDGAPVLRSKTPKMIDQEVWGILLAYNLVRLEMAQIADEAGVEPTRISFVTSLRFIQDEWLWCAVASPGSIPKHLKRLRRDIKRFILPPRRNRSNPREVKIKMSGYPRKRRAPPGRT